MQDEADVSVRRAGVGVRLRPAVVGLGADVPEAVLRVEAHRRELRPAIEHAQADLVDEVLDREADELVEDGVGEVGDLLRGDIAGRVGQDRIGRIGVLPADVQPDVQRAIPSLRQCRVLVPGEVGEGGARDLDQLQVATAGLVVGDRDASVLRASELEAGRSRVAAFAAEQAIGGVEPVAVGDTLPSLPIFLDDPTRYVPAPLETTYMRTWNECPEPVREAVTGAA